MDVVDLKGHGQGSLHGTLDQQWKAFRRKQVAREIQKDYEDMSCWNPIRIVSAVGSLVSPEEVDMLTYI